MLNWFKQRWNGMRGGLRWPAGGGLARRALLWAAGALVLFVVGLGIYWSDEPEPFPVRLNTSEKLAASGNSEVTGAATTGAMIRVAETLLDKPGGYLTNDILPPGIYLDNIPNWEFGALVQLRDLSRAMRESFSRSQSQSTEDPDLIIAEPNFHFDNDSWIFPATENVYGDAVDSLYSYLGRISDPANSDAQFFARADNLAAWLEDVETRLGSLSQRLSASVRQNRVNTDTAGEPAAAQSTPAELEIQVQTPWLEVDDVFYEARGAAWALMHFLKAVEIDFAAVVEDKNAGASLRQIIRELEASQATVYFPVILNGSGFGVFANHSLTMANYISRANAAIIDLRNLLEQG
ncbi:MAG: DUF2333 family protein [Gammaproteobacteria bacterium]|nr:DUF2333 family protein [Gammaproteobacteria bacterium]